MGKSGGDQVVCKTIASLKKKLTAALSAKNLGPYKAALAARKQEFCGGSKHHKTRCQAFKLISEKLPAFEQKLGFDSSAPAEPKPAETEIQAVAKAAKKAAAKEDKPADTEIQAAAKAAKKAAAKEDNPAETEIQAAAKAAKKAAAKEDNPAETEIQAAAKA